MLHLVVQCRRHCLQKMLQGILQMLEGLLYVLCAACSTGTLYEARIQVIARVQSNVPVGFL